MIITCPNCKKQFKIDPTLIPEDGRDLKCGSCNHVWYYKFKDINSKLLTLNENIDNNEIKLDKAEIESDDQIEKNQPITKKINKKDDKINIKKLEKQKSISKDKTKNNTSKFFSYLTVFIISFVALVILLDTLKTPLTNIFPGLEIILLSLFETLHDIKLFIKDLY